MDQPDGNAEAAGGSRLCPTCGKEIPVLAPEGLCPVCLLDADTLIMPPVAEPRPVSGPPRSASSEPEAPDVSGPSENPDRPKGPVVPQFAIPIEKLRELFPELEIIDLLGAGGMGAVYRARQPRLDRLVALKVLTCPPEFHDDFALRFEREAQVLARLNHPNIVTIFDFGEIDRSRDEESAGNLFYFLMEFVDGADLNKMIRTGELTPPQALRIVPQICDALQFAHDAGITHRDIKPANILVDKAGNVRIADFGLAKLIGAESDALGTGLTLTGTSMGTPYYMAPEQWDSTADVDHRADIYSLGVVFYEMLTGERPQGVFDPPSRVIQVDVRVDEVVLKAMEKDIERRYQQASEIKEDVTRVNEIPMPHPRMRKVGGGPKIAAAAACLVLLGAGGWWWSQRDGVEVSGSRTSPAPVEAAPGEEKRGKVGKEETGSVAVVADDDLAPPTSPGRLRASGVTRWGDPIDLSRAGGMEDFVEVLLDGFGWIGLRENGEVLHSKWGRRPESNVKRLLPGLHSYGMIDENGKLTLVGNAKEEAKNTGITPGVSAVPGEVQRIGIVDAAWSAGIAIARLRDGSTRVWGESYEREFAGEKQWSPPPPQALKGVVDIALSQAGCATLTADGALHLWGAEFAQSEFPLLDGKVVSIDSGSPEIRVLLDDGRLFAFLSRYGVEGEQLADGLEEMAGSRILRKGADRWEYLHQFAAFNPLVSAAIEEVPRLSPRQFAVGPLYQPKGGEPDAGVVWIESAEKTGMSPDPQPVYPTDGGGFRAWLEGKVFQVTEYHEGATHDDLFWISDGRLRWLGNPRNQEGKGERLNWEFSVSERGEISWNWWGEGKATHWIQIAPDGKRFDKRFRNPGSGKEFWNHGQIRDDLSPPR